MRVDALAPDAEDRAKADAKIAADPDQDFPIEPLGSGSDFSAFLDHLGVPALDVGFGGEGEASGVYHSRYDTFEHHSRFVDPGFVYDALLAKTDRADGAARGRRRPCRCSVRAISPTRWRTISIR